MLVKMRFCAAVSLAWVLVLPGCDLATTSPASNTCTKSYCGDISMHISMTADCQGYGYKADGTVTLTFSEPPPDYTVNVRLNAQSISGRKRTNGKTKVEVPISGSSVACPFKNPSDLVITDPGDYVLATIRFNWENGRCPSCF